MTENTASSRLAVAGEVRLVFDGEKNAVTLFTPAGQKLTLSDDAQVILLEDLNGNSLRLSPEGIQLKSDRDISLQAGGKISLSAVQGISMASQADVQTTGLNVKSVANVQFTAQGRASAELSAEGQTVIRGAMVKIN